MKGELDLTRLKAYAATPSRWADVADLFGERGACAGCWCMFWRVPRKQFEAGKGAINKRGLRDLVIKGGKPGVIAYLGKEPIGWCAVAPRADYVGLERSKILSPVDAKLVWSISCLFVKRPYRRQGVSTYLIREAVKLAVSRGAAVVEGYPVEPAGNKMADPFLWHGVASAFKAAGFREVARRADTRPIMRFLASS
ncbi:MAG TPA: GNAT family N-acetyltransferase [Pyrinomonadaceae bacterium]|nr:GNAT family N-acetyltransferase [Pyrinomonadaceae bacterium]